MFIKDKHKLAILFLITDCDIPMSHCHIPKVSNVLTYNTFTNFLQLFLLSGSDTCPSETNQSHSFLLFFVH